MKNKAVFTVIACLALLPLLARAEEMTRQQPAAAQTSNTISLDIKGMEITDVLKMLAGRAGINIVVGKNVNGRVTMFLKDVDVWDAFEIILLANELAYEKKGGIINVMTQRDYELIYGERYQDKKQAKVIRLLYARAIDLSKALNQIKSNIGRIVADEASNTLTLIDTPEKLNEMEAFIKSTDLPVQTRVFALNYAQADKISAKILESVTKGVGSVKVDERTNKIVVTDYPAKLEELATVITAFDEKTPQVLIDAQIIEINPQKDQFSMGVDWDYWLKKNVRFVGSMAAPAITDITDIPNKLSLGTAAAGEDISEKGQYKSVIDMLRVIGETKILSSPRIMALNNQEAKILVGTKEAYITSAVSQTDTASVTSQTVNFVDVGIKLYVTPTVNRDGFVTMKIKPEVSSAKTSDIISEGEVTQIPIVTTSESETTIMVKDGTTIIIAGLKKDQRIKEVRKIPLLGDIPFLGALARNKKEETIKTELVIFITPHIVSGQEPLEYVSLTNNKDIGYVQSFADAQKKSQDLKNMSFDEYKAMVMDEIKLLSYQLKDEDMPEKGDVTLSFVLEASGLFKAEPSVVSSTNKKLDSLALESVNKAAPFSPFPAGSNRTEETFNVTLTYK